MLRTRILAAATAAVLMMGMSVGGAGAALADEAPSLDLNPAAVNNGPPPHPDGGANQIPICHATPADTAANGWNLLTPDDDAVATNQSGHSDEHDADIIPAFSYWLKIGNGNDATWEERTFPGKNLTTDFGGFSGAQILANDCVKPTAPPPPTIYEVGLYLYKKLDPNAPASWPNSGPQTFIDSQLGTAWFTEFPSVLPENVCGEGWAVQQDKVAHTGGFTWPASITYPDDNIGWPPIYDARHDNLETYLDVPDCEEAVAVVTVDDRDCFEGTSFVIDEQLSDNVTWGDPVIDEDEGTISIVATATNGALFDETLDGVSEDRTTRTFTEDYEPAGGDDCVAPAIGVTADAAKIECDTAGWFRFGPGLGVSDEDAARIVWTVGPVAYAGDTETGVQHPVTEAVTITVTASLDEDSEGDFALSDESGDGVVDPESGDITYTFIFTLPEDCEVDSVVVPEVTKVDECIEDEVIELDLVPSATAVASFTVTASPNVSYTYTINGGAPIAVVFPDGESSVTIPVTPGDTVVVTASAADPYSLPEGYEPWEHTFDGSEACVDLPELANWPVSASATDQICTPTGSLVSGSITVVFPVGPVENPNPVRYFIAYGTPQQQELTSAVTPVAPGSYVVTAIPRVPTDSVGDGGLQVDIPLTVGASIGDDCELDTLAFTGAGAFTNWLGVIAVLLTVAGMGFVVRRHRVEV